MENLKLRAEDIEDITILSAYLQDAITKMGDITYQGSARRFIMMLNRYVWEDNCSDTDEFSLKSDPDDRKNCCRIRTGLHFEDVLAINSQNIAMSLKEHPLVLLSIEARKTPSETFLLDFIFSGHGVIRLECEIISGFMKDIGEPWSAKCHPKHKILNALQDDNPENTG
ncbi:MAG: DUF2948 family protein [Emcibacter sp.]|nr:DUF2948 family protein [Emcibacter sp.]